MVIGRAKVIRKHMPFCLSVDIGLEQAVEQYKAVSLRLVKVRDYPQRVCVERAQLSRNRF